MAINNSLAGFSRFHHNSAPVTEDVLRRSCELRFFPIDLAEGSCVMDRAKCFELETDESRTPDGTAQGRRKWKKRRGFTRKSHKASRPTTYMGQRSNSHPRSGM